MSGTVVLDGGYIATVDGQGTEYADGHIVVTDGRIVSVGAGPAPTVDGARRIDARGCVVTPGLVNTHNHLYQWATRGMSQQSTLFEWLTELYPVWAGIDEDVVRATTRAGLTWLARSGCTTAADHHYVFPDNGGDVFGALVHAAKGVGIRLHAVRGSMDLGEAQGGLPPDHIVETTDAALAATADAIDRFHDTAPEAMVRVAVGPCSPFSASRDLMAKGAELARERGVRLHTHLAETAEEEEQCLAELGATPVGYAEQTGWIGPDVWLAHGVHLSDEDVRLIGTNRVGVAHCPSSNARLGAGLAPVRGLLDAGAPVGLGVDGAASNEASGLCGEIRQAVLVARLRGGPKALTAREALYLGTMGGARCLGRDGEIGSIEPGKLADLAVWRVDGLGHAGIADPVVSLAFGSQPPLEHLLVGGESIVERGAEDEPEIARDLAAACRTLAERAR
jgi:cytosine/adenosine deaminase-related metal-dependent hydrolase